MIVVCRSVKGGSGTTVTSAALGLLLATRYRGGGFIVDLNGDLPAALGLVEPSTDSPHDVNASLQLLPRSGTRSTVPHVVNWAALANEVAQLNAPVVVDAGTLNVGRELLDVATTSLLIIRPCYLALRRASHVMYRDDFRADGVVVVKEEGRALTPKDVSAVLRLPVRGIVDIDPAVARAVDAGLLSNRIPGSLSTSLTPLVDELTGSPHVED
jgi:hypothetical protein